MAKPAATATDNGNLMATIATEPANTLIKPTNIYGNSISLHKFLAADLLAAATASCAVSPVVTIMDKAAAEQAAYHRPLMSCLGSHTKSAISQPRQFLLGRSVRAMCILYAGTYSVANMSQTVGESLSLPPVTLATATSALTVAVNVSLGVWKDMLFARLATNTGISPEISKTNAAPTQASGRTPGRELPRAVALTFLVRDAITIFWSFTLADWVSAYLGSGEQATLAAQLIMPAASQILATPVHLLALDLYSVPGSLNLAARLSRQSRNMIPTTVIRSIRIVPALGLGVFFNKKLRLYTCPHIEPL